MNVNFPMGGTGALASVGSGGSSVGGGSTAINAINNANARTSSDIDKLQRDFDKNLLAANKALEAANAASAKADAYFPISEADLNYRDSFRNGMNNYNVTVNGALDSESTARQIITLLNDSQARGTLGASGLIGAVGF
jgi:hypothetical protein